MPGRDGERSLTGATVQRWLKGAFTERLGYKGAALFFAVVLWVVVSAEEPSEKLVPVRLEASYDSARTMTGRRPVIHALVAGRARDLIKLFQTPPIVRRTVTDDAPDSLAVELRASDVYIPPDLNVIVRDVQPRSLVLVFDVTTSRRVPVTSAVQVVMDSGRKIVRAGLTQMVPDSVTVTGPRRVVNTMASVRTVDQTVTVHDSGDFVIPLELKALAAGITVTPTEVRLFVKPPPVARAVRDSARIAALQPR
jgi:YbbR domain-containing protein